MAQKGPFSLRLWQFKTAYIDGGDFPIDDLAFLERHRPSLRTLNLRGEQQVDMAQVNAMRTLETLIIVASRGATEPLRLAGFPELRRLSVFDADDGPDRLVIDWEAAPPLEEVSLDDPSPDDVRALSSLPSLRSVSLGYARRLPHLPETLEELSLEGRFPECPVPSLPLLRSLALVDLTVGPDLSMFEGSGALAELEISGVHGLASLAGLRVGEGATVTLTECPHLHDLAAIDQADDVDLDVYDCPLLEEETS